MKTNFYNKFNSLFLPRIAEFIYIEGDNKSHFPYVNSRESIVIDCWRRQSPQNYSLVINKIDNSSRRHTLLLSPLIE